MQHGLRTIVFALLLVSACAAAAMAYRPVRVRRAVRAVVAVIRPPTVTAPVVLPRGPATHAAPAGAPDVLVVLLDSMRRDHVGAYGYRRATTPFIDSLARDGAVFENAVSQSSWTYPAVAALMTGAFPSDLRTGGAAADFRMPRGRRTMASVFAHAGYRTVALSDHPGIAADDWGAGFDTFDALRVPDLRRWIVTESDEDTIRSRWDGLLASTDGRPTFAYLHLFYPHEPYEPKPPWDVAFGSAGLLSRPWARQRPIDLYDGEIGRTDALLRELVARFRRTNRASIAVVLADHGEALNEHDLAGHGHSLFDELVRVPLVVNAPGLVPPGVRVREVAGLVDVLPTMAEMAGIAAELSLGRGRSFASKLTGTADAGEDDERDRWALSELPLRGAHRRSARSATVKVIVEDGRTIAFDLGADPDEQQPRNVADVAGAAALADALSRIRPMAVASLDPERQAPHPASDARARRSREALESLGYVSPADRPQRRPRRRRRRGTPHDRRVMAPAAVDMPRRRPRSWNAPSSTPETSR